jgi:hypothetical protein
MEQNELHKVISSTNNKKYVSDFRQPVMTVSIRIRRKDLFLG